jgi:anti-anti-sigma regulatory factor
MKIEAEADRLSVRDLRGLTEQQTAEIVEDVRAALAQGVRVVEFDLSKFRSIDCSVVDRLLAIHTSVAETGSVVWRLLNPPPDVRQLLELVRLHRLFEINPPRFSEMAVL